MPNSHSTSLSNKARVPSNKSSSPSLSPSISSSKSTTTTDHRLAGKALPSVRSLLASRDQFEKFYRPWATVRSPLASLYRIYLAILCRQHSILFKEVRVFWEEGRWRVSEIPKPAAMEEDDDGQTLAVLAAIPYVLVRTFNDLITRNIPRGVLTNKMMSEMAHGRKSYEMLPQWARSVPPLGASLYIPDGRGRVPQNSHDGPIDAEMCKKNIWMFALHVQLA